jgi:hypothetical protein
MDSPPRPSTLSEILDRTIQIYRRRFLVFIGIAAAPYAAVLVPVCIFLLLGWWLWNGGQTSPATVAATTSVLVVIGFLIVAPVWIIVTALATGALTHAAAHSCFDEAITIRGTWKEAWAHGWRYIGLYLLEALLIWGAPALVWTLLLMTGAAIAVLARNLGLGASAGVLAGLMAALLVAGLAGYAVWMLLRLALAFPACAVEGIGVMDALKRGPLLSQGTKGRIFLLYLLGLILNYLLTLAIILPLTIVAALVPGMGDPAHAQIMSVVSFVAMYGMGIAAQALVKPVYAIAMVLFYFDQRIRHEGFDIEWMMMRAGLVVPAPVQPEPEAWMPQPAETLAGAAAVPDHSASTESALPAAGTAESAVVAEGEIP